MDKQLYPMKVMHRSNKEGTMPKCIFLPSRRLIRLMIRQVIDQESSYVTEESFLLRMGLIDNLNHHLE